MTDQDVDFACLAEENDELRPMRLRYGTTPDEAGRREPLDVALSQEEPEVSEPEQGVWDDVDDATPSVVRTHAFDAPDSFDEEQVSGPAEQDAVHTVDVGE